MWLIVGQMPIKAGWQDSSLMLWELHPLLYNKDNPFFSLRFCNIEISQAVLQSCSLKMVFLKNSQNSQVFALAQMFPVNFAKFFFTKHLFSQNTTSGCFWHLYQWRFPILIMYVIKCSWSVNIFSFFLQWRMVEWMV